MKTDKYLDADYQRQVSDFVGREVIYCASALVYELAQKAEHFPDYEEDLYSAFQSEPDYESALNEAGYFYQVGRMTGAPSWRDPDGVALLGYESAKELFDELGLDDSDYTSEIFEHWIVTDWLAERLEEKGERVLHDFFGLTIWGRSTTGQAISIDRVICDIYDELQEQKP